MAARIPRVPELGDDLLKLTTIVLGQSWMPNPSVVQRMAGPAFPAVRDQKRRITVDTSRGVLRDDNTSPRWALLWAHGFAGVAHPKGWTVAHVWPESNCEQSYTHPANMMLVPEHFGSLTDKQSPLCNFFRFHSWRRYSWKPPQSEAPTEPDGYKELRWRYLDEFDNPRGFIRERVWTLENARCRLLRSLMAD